MKANKKCNKCRYYCGCCRGEHWEKGECEKYDKLVNYDEICEDFDTYPTDADEYRAIMIPRWMKSFDYFVNYDLKVHIWRYERLKEFRNSVRDFLEDALNRLDYGDQGRYLDHVPYDLVNALRKYVILAGLKMLVDHEKEDKCTR